VRHDDIEAIKQLKYAYVRLLDLKKFNELGELLTPNCTASYQDGTLSFEGRQAIVDFLIGSLGDTANVTAHFVHHPEITFTGDTSAVGIWYLQDRVIARGFDLDISGTAFYRDEYVRADGSWRFSHTGYERVFEEHRVASSMERKRFTSRF